VSFRRGFKLVADADLTGGYIAELESRYGNAYLSLIFYDEQQNELREFLEKHDGQVMLYLGPVPKVTATAEVIQHNKAMPVEELQQTADYLVKYKRLIDKERNK
jgi:hypothetical protein